MLGIIKEMRKLCPGISEKAMEQILRVGFELYAKRMAWLNTGKDALAAPESYLTGLFVAYTDCGWLNFNGDAVEFRMAIRDIIENWISPQSMF